MQQRNARKCGFLEDDVAQKLVTFPELMQLKEFLQQGIDVASEDVNLKDELDKNAAVARQILTACASCVRSLKKGAGDRAVMGS